VSESVRGAARRSVRRVTDAYGQSTRGRRVLPDFLIVGAQRCGTTTLFRTLDQHPAVLPPTLRKGVHYFDLSYQRDLSWYRGHFPTQAQVDEASAAAGVRAVVGESSPYYMWHPAGPERIAANLPDVRLLVALRDPVERAYSAHAHELARGYETVPFEEALELEQERIGGAEQVLVSSRGSRHFAHQHQSYVTRGQYIDQLERLEHHLGRSRIHVVDAADFWSDPEPHWAQVLEFLGLPEHPVTFERHNARKRSPMPDSLRHRLEDHFADFDRRLATWWGHTPSWRR
jgi:hypothetical protein